MGSSLEVHPKAQKIIEKLQKYKPDSIERELLIVILTSIERLEKREFELLDIRKIQGEKNKGLKEIRIHSPLNYRIFFQEIEGCFYVAEICAKKTDKFPQSFFDTIINRLKKMIYMIVSLFI